MKLALIVFLAAGAAALHSDEKERARGFKEFTERVNLYVSLQKKVEGTLPALKSTELPELITAHQQALARKIREARPKARQGDIFTSAASEAFRHAVRKASEGSRGTNVRATIKQGEPMRTLNLRVNDVYPDKLPFTTVPPTVLQALPKLPNEVVYRIVGRNLLLLDARANLVVDLIPKGMPEHFVLEQ